MAFEMFHVFPDHFTQTCSHLPDFPVDIQALIKLEASLDAGHSYEGHELFKTVFYRLRSRRQTVDSYVLAEVILKYFSS